ncbi:unnamed protein product, partial [Ectocarpus sp. 13 AM-2016]
MSGENLHDIQLIDVRSAASSKQLSCVAPQRCCAAPTAFQPPESRRHHHRHYHQPHSRMRLDHDLPIPRVDPFPYLPTPRKEFPRYANRIQVPPAAYARHRDGQKRIQPPSRRC